MELPKMATSEQLNLLIEQAAKAVGSQTRLAKILGIPKSHISQMKAGTRTATWKVRGSLRAIAGEEPARAFMTAMAEELEHSEKEDEKKAAEGFKAILAAFPEAENQKPQVTDHLGFGSGGNGGIRTLDEALHPILP